MKTIKFLFMIAIIILVSCNTQGNRRGVESSTNTEGGMGTGARLYDNDQGNDEDFVREAARMSQMELELGRYAQQNAQNPRVKQFGAMLVRDHSKASEELRGIAAKKNINISDAMEDSHRNKISDLQEKSGSEFDEDFMKEMVDDHEKAVDKFKKQAEEGEDSELKAFAAKTLPVLLMHQDSAKNIREALDR
jgi:putative membrane protein